MNFGERVKALRDCLRIAQADFGRKIGVTSSAISRIEADKRQPSEQVIQAILMGYGVNEAWLRNGEGEMFCKTADTVLQEFQRHYQLTDLQTVAVRAFLKLDANQRDALLEYITTANNLITELCSNAGLENRLNQAINATVNATQPSEENEQI